MGFKNCSTNLRVIQNKVKSMNVIHVLGFTYTSFFVIQKSEKLTFYSAIQAF